MELLRLDCCVSVEMRAPHSNNLQYNNGLMNNVRATTREAAASCFGSEVTMAKCA